MTLSTDIGDGECPETSFFVEDMHLHSQAPWDPSRIYYLGQIREFTSSRIPLPISPPEHILIDKEKFSKKPKFDGYFQDIR